MCLVGVARGGVAAAAQGGGSPGAASGTKGWSGGAAVLGAGAAVGAPAGARGAAGGAEEGAVEEVVDEVGAGADADAACWLPWANVLDWRERVAFLLLCCWVLCVVCYGCTSCLRAELIVAFFQPLCFASRERLPLALALGVPYLNL